MATKGERSEPRAEDTTYRRPEARNAPQGVERAARKGAEGPEP